MQLGTYLVTFKAGVTKQNVQRLAALLGGAGGGFVMVAGNSRAVIVSATQPLAEQIRRLPFVRHVGGVRIGQRKVVRRQIHQD